MRDGLGELIVPNFTGKIEEYILYVVIIINKQLK